MNKKEPFNLILLGDPGAGKGTQGIRLVKKYPLREFDFGSWLRKLTDAERAHYKVDSTTAKGILTPAGLAKAKFHEVIVTTPKAQGVFFNGNPKMVVEARTIAAAFKEVGREAVIVLYLTVPQKEMLARLRKRQAREARSDDQEEYLRNRMKYYRKHVKPTVEFFRKKYRVVKISGVGTEAAVFKRIVTALEKLKSSIN